MKIVLLGVVVFILLINVVLLFNDYCTRKKHQKLISYKYNVIRPLLNQLEAKELMGNDDILSLAKDPSLRLALFRALELHHREDLFPSEYLTLEKGAEGFLVSWLEFPTELGRAPRKIELVTVITIKEKEALDYYVFRFRSDRPRWAAKCSWMLGVTGPYKEDSLPYDLPLRVFSRFRMTGDTSPQVEAAWVHKNINPSAIRVL